MQFDTLEDSLQYLNESHSGKDIFEAGVLGGRGLERLIRGFHTMGLSIRHVWGADSFRGLCPEDPDVYHNPEWLPGVFDVCKDFNLETPEQGVQFVYDRLAPFGVPVTLIPGWFSDTLVPGAPFLREMGTISYVHVDADLFISSYQFLDFCFAQKLIGPDTLVRLDDVLSTPANGGQKLAMFKIGKKYKPEIEWLSLNVFRVHGYEVPS